MIGHRVGRYSSRIREELRTTFAEEHTPREIAGSFSLGTFITMLPTLGLGILLFLVIAYLFDRISKVALFASIVVFNPVVKWGVYAASVTLGVLILGPIDDASIRGVSMDASRELLLRLLVGNLILAVLATAISYVIVYRLAVAYRSTELGKIIDDAVEKVVDQVTEA